MSCHLLSLKNPLQQLNNSSDESINFGNMLSAFQLPETASQSKYSQPYLVDCGGLMVEKCSTYFLVNEKFRNKHVNYLRT